MRVRATGFLALVASLALVLPGAASHATTAPGGHRIVEVTGIRTVGGLATRVDVFLDLAPGEDTTTVARDALLRAGARPLRGPSAEYILTGPKWPQFFDHDKRNDVVRQVYNPDGQNVIGDPVAALRSAQQEWTDVSTASFALAFDGTTTATAAPVDGVNVVTWPSVWTNSRSAFAVTLTTFELATGFILDSDVLFNRDFSFFSDPTEVTPGRADIRYVMLHEDGHVAGLDHSPDPSAVMFCCFRTGIVGHGLAQDDIDGISTLYPLNATIKPPHPEHPEHPQGRVTVQVLARLGDPAPGGGFYDFDFEPYALSNRGEAAYAADFFDPEAFAGGEGAFLARGADAKLIGRTGDPAPGGGVLGFGVWVNMGLNERGDSAFSFALEPFRLPAGLNSGVYRYDGLTRALEPVVVPNVTPAPGGGAFVGAYRHADVNARGDVAFAGIVLTDAGITRPYGSGVYMARRGGGITPVAAPGDPAPGGGAFDFAEVPSVNDAGEVAFGAHVRGEECLTSVSQTRSIHCDTSLYLRRPDGRVVSLVHAGDPAPDGGVFRSAYDPVLNNRGDVLFLADLTPAPFSHAEIGIFLHMHGGEIVPIALPGQELPGGGHLLAAPFQYGNWSLSDTGDVAFSALLDTDTLGYGEYDTGLYIWRNGALGLIARTGSELAGVGNLLKLAPPLYFGFAFSGAALNDRGEVCFQVTTTDFTGALLIAETR